MCLRSGESIDHLFLHCVVTLNLWNRLFSIARIDRVWPKGVTNMLYISFRRFVHTFRGRVL